MLFFQYNLPRNATDTMLYNSELATLLKTDAIAKTSTDVFRETNSMAMLIVILHTVSVKLQEVCPTFEMNLTNLISKFKRE